MTTNSIAPITPIAARLALGLALIASTGAHAQQQGGRAPSGTGTITTEQATAKMAASGTPTTTAMTGAPTLPAPAAKPATAGTTGSTPPKPSAMHRKPPL